MTTRVSLFGLNRNKNRSRLQERLPAVFQAGYSQILLPFMKNSINARDYQALVDLIFDIRDQIKTCCEISYPEFSYEEFNKTSEFTIVFFKPTTHTNGNFTRINTWNIIQRFAKGGWFPRAVRLFRGQALPPQAIIVNYADPFAGKGEYCKIDETTKKGKPGSQLLAKEEKIPKLNEYLQGIYGNNVEDLLFIHSYDLLDKKAKGHEQNINPIRKIYGHFPLEFITTLWKKGYEHLEEDIPQGINKIPKDLTKNEKTRIFKITEKNIQETLNDMDWSEEKRTEVKNKLKELELDSGFIMCNGFACELLQALNRQDEFIPIFLFQRGKGMSPDQETFENLKEKIVGDTNPFRALPGSVRGDAYTWFRGSRGLEFPIVVPDVVEIANNILHCSENHENAVHEFELWFGKSLFQTLLMGSSYPKAEIEDMERNPIIGHEASKVNIFDYLLTNGICPFLRKFPPFPDTGPGSASIKYENWMLLREMYKEDKINIGYHLVDPKDLQSPPQDNGAIAILSPTEGEIKSIKIRYLGGMAGQSYRYYPPTVRENQRVKAIEKLEEINSSPIELKLNEFINWLNQPDNKPIVVPLFITNNYTHERVREHIKFYLENLDEGVINQFYGVLQDPNHSGNLKAKEEKIEEILDQIISLGGSLPRMIPQGEDLKDNSQYLKEQLKRWCPYYAPIHYISHESDRPSIFDILSQENYKQVTEEMFEKDLIELTPEEMSMGLEKERSGIYRWKLETLALTKGKFNQIISGLPHPEIISLAWKNIRAKFVFPPQELVNQVLNDLINKQIFNLNYSFWNPKILREPTLSKELEKGLERFPLIKSSLEEARSYLKTSYTFSHYLERAVTDVIREKGNPGDYCFDRAQNLTSKSPGHMDVLTHYILHQMGQDIKNNIKVAFASCAEDFAFEITNELIRHIERSSKVFTFLLKVFPENQRPPGGYVFSPKDPETSVLQQPRIYERFQFKKEDFPLPQEYFFSSNNSIIGYLHNLFQVGINLENLGKWLFGESYATYVTGEIPEERVKDILWEKIYRQVDPLVEVRAVDQGHIWAAQFVYFLGQLTHIPDLKDLVEFLLHENNDFPYTQIKYPEDMERASTFYQEHFSVRSKVEVEAKFEILDPQLFDQIKKLSSIGNLGANPLITKIQKDTYFDSSDLGFYKRHLGTLRLRESGGNYKITLKQPRGQIKNGIMERREDEETITPKDLKKLQEHKYFEKAREILDAKKLNEIITIETERTNIVFGSKEKGVEVSLDRVRYGDQEEREFELEIENQGLSPEEFESFIVEFKKLFPTLRKSKGAKYERGIKCLNLGDDLMKVSK